MASTSGVASNELKQKAMGFCSVAGLLVGVFTFGVAHVAFFLFPLAMVYAMFRTEKRGWLPAPKDADKPRRGLAMLSLTPLLLFAAAFPMSIFLLMFWALILSPFLLAVATWKPGYPNAGGKAVMIVLGTVSFVSVILLYAGLVGRSLRQFTGRWFRGLFWKLVAWIAALALIGSLVASKFIWESNMWRFLGTNWFVFPWWILSALAFYKMGAIFGRWLTGSDEALE